MRFCFLFLICFSILPKTAQGQIIYATQGDINSDLSFGTLNIETCTYTVLNPGPIIEFQDFSIGLNGEIFVALIGQGLGTFDVSTGISTLIVPITDFLANSVVTAPDGSIYAAGSFGFWHIYPSTGTFDFLGTLGPWSPEGDLAILNGDLFVTASDGSGSSCLVQINLSDPSASQCIQPLSYFANTGLIVVPSSTCGDRLFGTGVSIDPVTGQIVSHVYTLNPATGNQIEQCTFTDIIGFADFSIPPNYNFTGACCITDAGTVQTGDQQLCAGQPFNIPFENNAILDADDVLKFILFTNLNDTLGSIIAINDNPVFEFGQAPIQTNVTYYAAAIAGNSLTNGNINLNDPCLDLSNAISVIWRPRPSISLAAPSTICAEGACQTITANLSGQAPFSFSYNLVSGTTVLSTQTLNSTQNSFSFQICLPPGVSGQVEISISYLEDAYCDCAQ